MFGSSILEAGIGLVFVYLLLSLVYTTATEMIAALTKLRAKILEKGIRNLLDDSSGKSLVKEIYKHPLIKGLYRDEKRKPSYIPSKTFALVLMNIAIPDGFSRLKTMDEILQAIQKTDKINEHVKKALLVMIDEAASNHDKELSNQQKILKGLEVWYNQSMERVTGWYKRKTQVIAFILAVFFTFILNVDTISISKSLLNDSAMRASLVAAARDIASKPSASLPSAYDSLKATDKSTNGAGQQIPDKNWEESYDRLKKQIKEIQKIGIPVGWYILFSEDSYSKMRKVWWWLTKFFGLFLTILATSIGAPFWFDLLKRITAIRSTGKSPVEAPKIPKKEVEH